MDLEKFPTRKTSNDMLSTVTSGFYDNSYVGKWMFQVMGRELQYGRRKYDEMKEQIFPETATWALPYHEIKYGLPVSNNLSDEERRKLILIKRDTSRPMTPWQMEQIIKELTGHDVYINDNLEKPLTFEVTLKDGDKPIDFMVILQKLCEIKQSHVSIANISKEVNKEDKLFNGMAHTTSQEVFVDIKDGMKNVDISPYLGMAHHTTLENKIIFDMED